MPEKRNYTFKRTSVLKLKSDIQGLFDSGKRTNHELVKVIHLIKYDSSTPGVKVFFSAPKRLLHQANSRNTVKRRMREVIRLNYQDIKKLCKENSIELLVGLVWLKEYEGDYNKIEQNIVLSLQNIYNEIYEKLQSH